MYPDCPVHTCYSDDSEYPMEVTHPCSSKNGITA